MPEKIRCGDRLLEVALVRRHPHVTLRVGDQLVDLRAVEERPSGAISAEIGGRRLTGWRVVDGDEMFLRLDGRSYRMSRERPGMSGDTAEGGANRLRASMPGVVVSVECAVGQVVARGQTLIVIESMKMQTAIAAPRDGVVEQVHFAVDASFQKGATLVSLQTDAA